MDFLKNLFGKKSDTGLSKKGWLSIAVHRPTGRIITSSKGLMGNAGHWGEVGFLVENRIDDSKRHYDFVPDEEVIGFIVENIEKVPTLDKAKPDVFERYLKGLKEQKRVSIREYQYRKESDLKESDPLPSQYQTWVRLQDSRELKNRHTTDLRDFKKEIERHPFDTEALVALMQSYLTDSQLFGKFILAIAELKELDQRVQLYTQLEQVIEESSLYKQSRIEEMDYFLMIPPGEMEPIHVLACETLRDVLRKDHDGKLFGIPKSWLKGTQTYDRLCKMMLDYHTMKGLPLDYIDDEYNLRQNYSKEMESLVEATRLSGQYDETDSDAYPGLRPSSTPPITSPSVPIDMGKMLEEEAHPSSAQSLQQEMHALDNDRVEERMPQGESPAKKEAPVAAQVAQPLSEQAQPVTEATEQPVEGAAPPFDEQAESAKSIQRLTAGALLRDEIYSWRDKEAITRRQLEWAFAQPYINAEKLIRNGTLHGAVLKTRYFEELFERVASDSESLEQLPLVDRNILLAYGTSMERTRAEYDSMLEDEQLLDSDKASINRQKVSLESEYGRIQEQVNQLRLLEQQRLMDSALQLAVRWVEHFFAGTEFVRLSDEAFFQQLEDYTAYPKYIQTLLPVLERQGGVPKEQRKRSFTDLFYLMDRFHNTIMGGVSGARFVPHEQQQGLTPDQCGWGQVIYQLGFYVMERERLRQESDTDINAVCEMIQLHIRIGKKLQGWMLHALYWVIETEENINRYCERTRARYQYALDSYLTEEKEGLDPYVMTEEDQRMQIAPLQASLPQSLLSAFSRWYNAEEVWQWYFSGEAKPGGFQPAEPAEGQRSKPKRDRKKATNQTPIASEQPSQVDETETEVTPETPKTPETPEVKTEATQEVEPTSTEPSIDETQQTPPTPSGTEGKEAEQEEDSKYLDASFGGDDDFVAAIDDLPDTEGKPDESGEDEDKDRNLVNEPQAQLEEPAEDQIADDQDERLVDEFNTYIESMDLTYEDEQQAVFDQDGEVLAGSDQDTPHWKWAESFTLSNLGPEGQTEIEEWIHNFGQELSDDIDQQMALFICRPEDLGRRIYSFFSRSSNIEQDIVEMQTHMSALEKRIKGKSLHTLQLICESANERIKVLNYCLDIYKKSQEEPNS